MSITETQTEHFQRNGFFLIPNPFGEGAMHEVDRIQSENEPAWEATDWPDGFNIVACQFLMGGERTLELVEHPELLAIARHLLGTDEIHVGACGMGDASKVVSADGRPQQQVHWHADGGPEVKQVSFRTAFDRHDTPNAPLRVLPGTHLRSREEVREELTQIELASGEHDTMPNLYFASHPLEVEVKLDPRWTLVWTPSCWHATGVKTAPGPRRTMAWNYFPPGGRHRDREALKHIYVDEWEGWREERKKLWGLA